MKDNVIVNADIYIVTADLTRSVAHINQLQKHNHGLLRLLLF